MHTSPETTYPFPFQTVFDAARRSLMLTDMTVDSADAATGVLTAKSGFSMRSWGEKVEVKVWSIEPELTAVTVSSRLRFQVVGYGKNQMNVTQVLDGIARALGARPGAT